MNDDVEREIKQLLTRIPPPEPSGRLRRAVVADRATARPNGTFRFRVPRTAASLIGLAATVVLAAGLLAMAIGRSGHPGVAGSSRQATASVDTSASPSEGPSASPTDLSLPMPLPPRAASGTFVAAGAMSTSWQNAVALLDGRVLYSLGFAAASQTPLTGAEIYDPATGTFTPSGPMHADHSRGTVTRLADGRVLFAGGAAAPAEAEIFDPATGLFTTTGSLTVARYDYSAVLLHNGNVLLVGGMVGETATPSAELYDPKTGTFSATGQMATARWEPTGTLLNDGRVLVAGGTDGLMATVYASAEIYDPATGSFSATGSMTTPRYLQAATALQDGRVLVTGGYGPEPGMRELQTAELFDPAEGKFTSTGSLSEYLLGQSATLLNDGRVLIAGGTTAPGGGCGIVNPPVLAAVVPVSRSGGANMDVKRVDPGETPRLGSTCQFNVSTAEVYNPATGTFKLTGSMTTPRYRHTATLLSDGRVLIAGGEDLGVPPSAEIYTP